MNGFKVYSWRNRRRQHQLEETLAKEKALEDRAWDISLNVQKTRSLSDGELRLASCNSPLRMDMDYPRARYLFVVFIPQCTELQDRIMNIYNHFFDECLEETAIGEGILRFEPSHLRSEKRFQAHYNRKYRDGEIFNRMIDYLNEIRTRILKRTLTEDQYKYLMNIDFRTLKRFFLNNAIDQAKNRNEQWRLTYLYITP